MNRNTKPVLTLLGILFVLGYTYYNYSVGKTSAGFLLIAVFALALPFMNILGTLIDEWKHK